MPVAKTVTMKAAIKGFTAWSNIRLVGNSCEADNILKELMEGERLKLILQGINRRVTGSTCMSYHRRCGICIIAKCHAERHKKWQDHIRTGGLSKSMYKLQKPVVWSNFFGLPVTYLATMAYMPMQHAQYMLLFLVLINSDQFQSLWSYTLLLKPQVLMHSFRGNLSISGSN